MVTAQRTPGVVIRRAAAPTWFHFTFNGAPGSIVADERMRLAISKGINRQAIVDVVQHGLTNHPAPLNNHIYVEGQVGYQNNSAPADYNPDQARRDLDALGWKLNGAVREKDGKQLAVRDVFFDAQANRQIAMVTQNSLAQIGVKLVLDPKPGNGFFSQHVASAISTSLNSVGPETLSRFPHCLRYTLPTATVTSARSATPRSTPRSTRRCPSWIRIRRAHSPTRSTR